MRKLMKKICLVFVLCTFMIVTSEIIKAKDFTAKGCMYNYGSSIEFAPGTKGGIYLGHASYDRILVLAPKVKNYDKLINDCICSGDKDLILDPKCRFIFNGKETRKPGAKNGFDPGEIQILEILKVEKLR